MKMSQPRYPVARVNKSEVDKSKCLLSPERNGPVRSLRGCSEANQRSSGESSIEMRRAYAGRLVLQLLLIH